LDCKQLGEVVVVVAVVAVVRVTVAVMVVAVVVVVRVTVAVCVVAVVVAVCVVVMVVMVVMVAVVMVVVLSSHKAPLNPALHSHSTASKSYVASTAPTTLPSPDAKRSSSPLLDPSPSLSLPSFGTGALILTTEQLPPFTQGFGSQRLVVVEVMVVVVAAAVVVVVIITPVVSMSVAVVVVSTPTVVSNASVLGSVMEVVAFVVGAFVTLILELQICASASQPQSTSCRHAFF
jgi:hypothetical protein